MSAETLQAHAHPDDAAGASRARARLEAHRLVQRVQVDDCATELAERLAIAEARGWSDVVRLLLYADLVHAWTSSRPDYDVKIQRLHDRAEADGDPVLLAAALASRAEYRYSLASASVREQANRDLARAVAMLEVAEGDPLDRGAAYIDCGLAYGQRELWELEEEMYVRAHALLPECEEPLLERPLVLNRLVGNVHRACCLREMGEHEALRQLRRRLADPGRDRPGRRGAGPVRGGGPRWPGTCWPGWSDRHRSRTRSCWTRRSPRPAIRTNGPSTACSAWPTRWTPPSSATGTRSPPRRAPRCCCSRRTSALRSSPCPSGWRHRQRSARGRRPPCLPWPTATGAPAAAGMRGCSCSPRPGPASRQSSCGSSATCTPTTPTTTS